MKTRGHRVNFITSKIKRLGEEQKSSRVGWKKNNNNHAPFLERNLRSKDEVRSNWKWISNIPLIDAPKQA
jgi:hypothetical protein